MSKTTETRRSALYEIYKTGDFAEPIHGDLGVRFCERRELSIIQVAAWEAGSDEVINIIGQVVGVMPVKTGCSVVQSDDTAAIWIGPNRWLIVEKEHRDLYGIIRKNVDGNLAAVTDQSHSRCVIRLCGEEARNVLRKGCMLDMDIAKFKADEARTTSLFNMNGLIHCLGENNFDIYVARSFGQSFFEVITHGAAEYGYQIEGPI